jgi:putative Mn2+ efflux pump MntP
MRTIKDVAEEYAVPIVSSTIISSLGLVAAKVLQHGSKKYLWIIPGLIIGGVGAYYQMKQSQRKEKEEEYYEDDEEAEEINTVS